MKIPVVMAPEALDFSQLVRAGETIGRAEATAEPVFLSRLLDSQAERCPPFRVFFALDDASIDFLSQLPVAPAPIRIA